MSTDQVVSRYPEDHPWVEPAARALFDHEWREPAEPSWGELSAHDRDSYRRAIGAVLAALEEVGALLPPGMVKDGDEECMVRTVFEQGIRNAVGADGPMTRRAADMMAAALRVRRGVLSATVLETEVGDWWDDLPRNGGACIGDLLRCTECDWEDSR